MKLLTAILNGLLRLLQLYQRWTERQDKQEAVEEAAAVRADETEEVRREVEATVAGLDRAALNERLRKHQRQPKP